MYGIESASEFYYNNKASNLSLAEASLLAGIPKAPTYYSPINDYKAGKKEEGLALLKAEIKAYPESEKFISRIIKQLEK